MGFSDAIKYECAGAPRFSRPLNVAGNIARDKLRGIPF